MPSELIWKGFEVHTTWNKWLGTFPVTFNPKTRLFEVNQNHKQMLRYYFTVFIVIGGFGMGSISIRFLLSEFTQDFKLSFVQSSVFFAVLLVEGLVVGIAFFMVVFGNEMIPLLNSVIRNFKRLEKLTGNEQKEKHFWMDQGRVDMFGIFIMYAMVVSLFFPAIGTIFGIAADLTPWELLIEQLLPTYVVGLWQTRTILTIFSSAVLFIQIAEGSRLMILLLFVVAFPIQLWIRSIALLDELHRQAKRVMDYLKLCDIYAGFWLLNQRVNRFSSPEAFCLMKVSVSLSAAFNFIVLKLYNVMPLGIYLIFVFGAVVTLSLMGMILPYATQLHENSTENLTQWKAKLMPGMKLVRKKYRSLRPIQFTQGLNGIRFYVLEQSSKSEYYEDVANNTINLCVSVPDSAFQ